MGEGDADWKRAHLIKWVWCWRERCRLEESALESGIGVEERDTDWERAQLIARQFEGGRHRLGESALESGSGVGEGDTD